MFTVDAGSNKTTGTSMDQEEFVLVLVPVPDEWALELDELHVVSVHFPDDLRVPMGREQGELLRQVDLIHASSAHPLCSCATRLAIPSASLRTRPYHMPHSFTEYSALAIRTKRGAYVPWTGTACRFCGEPY